jgi:AraC family cel operon transcriptional repressor
METVLQLEDHLQEGAYFYAARQNPRPAKAQVPTLHSHHFHELFWIESGEGQEYTADGFFQLSIGDLVFVRPEDRHGFGSTTQSGVTLLNVAFPSRDWLTLCSRHGGDFPDLYAGSPAQRRRKISQHDYALLMDWGKELAAGQHRAIDLERFLLNLVNLVAGGQDSSTTQMPDWLSQALENLHDPKHFVHGAPVIATLCQRSPEHVARAVRRFLGCTPTDVVNGIRLEWAAERLVSSHDDILQICLDCGWDNLGYFYRQFAKRFGTTPKRWRQRAWRIAGNR